jgi:glutamine---fructose-6-phosphate transaminase (isomerizing)
MCGIVGYIGGREAAPILIEGLHKLEYRGYDSAGIAVAGPEGVHVVKRAGRVDGLEEAIRTEVVAGSVGIGHTRWATHGLPNQANAHPHQSADGRITIAHNGIIENYAVLRRELVERGVTFASDTDTEVLANLIAVIAAEKGIAVFDAVQEALQTVRGAYAIIVIDREDPDRLVVAALSSPLAIGISSDELLVGSDSSPIVAHTREVVYLQDEQVAELRRDGGYRVISLAGVAVEPDVLTVAAGVDDYDKGRYEHYMLKEMHEQPTVVRETIRGRLSLDGQTVLLGGIVDFEQRILRAQKLTILACGTSWHAGLVGKYLIEDIAQIPVELEYASEFRYRAAPVRSDSVFVAISQSGETADTLAAVRLAREAGALTLGVVNVVGSSLARATDGGVYTRAGAEISVASTKAFTAQVTVLSLMALRFAQQLGTRTRSELQELYRQLAGLPDLVEQTLVAVAPQVKTLVKYLDGHNLVLFLGRGAHCAVALEGALKLKEITYIAAEGYPAGELKHGPIALIGDGSPVIALVPGVGTLREKMIGNMQEVRARGASVIAIASVDDDEIAEHAEVVVRLPPVADAFSAIPFVLPLQFLAYYMGQHLGTDVDRPRNLAKSVTVE